MTETPNLALPYILAAQAQKHVTHNEAIRALDCLIQLAVESRSLTTAPTSPDEGRRYLVATAATGAWSGQSEKIAAFQDGTWAFYEPREGWVAWVADEASLVVYSAGAWAPYGGTGTGTGGGGTITALDDLNHVGINATADTTNRLSLKSPASLFDNEGGGHQQKINKHATADTASVLYQTNYSGRAEMGLTGDDDFHFKVSPDGSAWYDAIKIDRASGSVDLPKTGQLAGFRNLLINGDGRLNQRAPASNADNTYGHDRWIALTQTGTIAVSTVIDAENGTPRMWRLSQSQATAQRMGYAQWIEGANCKYLRGKTVTLSGRVRFSLNAAVRYAICEWTGTEDTPSSARDVVNDWTNGTYTGGNFFKGTTFNVLAVGSLTPAAAALTDLPKLTATLGGAANNLVVILWTEGAAAQNATLDAVLQLEIGSAARTREMRPTSVELGLCQRYLEVINFSVTFNLPSSGNIGGPYLPYNVVKRVNPTLARVSGSWGGNQASAPTPGNGSINGWRHTFTANAANAVMWDDSAIVTADAEI